MSWFADLAGRAENLLNNLDEQTGAALRNHNITKTKKFDNNDYRSDVPKKKLKTLPKKFNGTELRPRTSVPMSRQSRSPIRQVESSKEPPFKTRKSPTRRGSSPTSSPNPHMNSCPRTLVGDVKEKEEYEKSGRYRRYSLPSELEGMDDETLNYKIQNLEVENAMIRNEHNFMNREIAELLERLRKTEDEVTKTQSNLEKTDLLKNKLSLENDALNAHLEMTQRRLLELESVIRDSTSNELRTEINILRDTNKDLEDEIKSLQQKLADAENASMKLENDARHAQIATNDLQNDLEKSKVECKRLESEWQAYKVRVKNMLASKDQEIKSLQKGMNLTEDTKILMEQIDRLNQEREELSENVIQMRNECEDMRLCIDKLENKSSSAERVAAALRDALREERAGKSRLEMEVISLSKEIKQMQIESSQTLTSLRNAIKEKETEIQQLLDSNSSLQTSDTSALNVADYDVTSESIENEKIQYLTNALVQRQGKIESLMADNNMLRIQLDKVQTKLRNELALHKTNSNHSVVQLHDHDIRPRNRNIPDSPIKKLSVRFGVFMKRYPIFRLFMLVYMVSLHFWVLTVLLTSTPENYIPKRAS